MSDIHNHEDHHEDHSHGDEVMAAKKSARPQIERNNKYWQNLEQYNNDPKFWELAEKEFRSSPLQETESSAEGGWARREFIKLMGASLAMASASCIRRPVQKLVPYNKQPEEVTLGVPNFYTSTYFDGSEALGLLIKTREGRPIKIEGNPSHPINKGGVSARAQASLMSLYDPERLQGPKRNLFNDKRSNKEAVGVSWDDLNTKVSEQLKKGGVALLTGASASPSTRAVYSDFSSAFKANHVVWEPLAYEDVREGQQSAYGDAQVPYYRFDKAKIIVSIDADFLGTWVSPVAFAKQFSQSRRDPAKMSKLVVFDSHYSLTGANADIRFRIKPSLQLDVVCGLISELVSKGRGGSSDGIKSAAAIGKDVHQRLGIEKALFAKIASDLWDNRGQSLVVAGGLATQTQDSKALQAAVNLLNSMLDNDGKTILAKSGQSGLRSSNKDILDLIQDMKNGKVKTLLIHRTNPLYTLPKELGFEDAMKKVEMIVYGSMFMDETAQQSHYIATDNHPLENWGDAEVVSGVFSIQQPAIAPMYDTTSFQLSLMTWAFMLKQGSKRLQTYETFYDFVRAYWREEILPKAGRGQGFEDFWGHALETGFVGEQASSSARSYRTGSASDIKKTITPSAMELVLYPTVQLGDGTLSNVAWLQELPDPVTKIVWDNYAMLSLKAAESLKLKEGSVIEITVNGKKMEVPVHIQPGLHDEVIAMAVGYGRTRAGKVGNGVGFNAYDLASAKDGQIVYSGHSVAIKKLSRTHELACPQGHHTMEGRQIVVEATLEDYKKDKGANIHRHKTWSLWSGHAYNGHKWGMVIDQNTCTGCSACMTACQSENNIQVVGKKYVMQGREMHWIRIDRYYTGTPESAAVVFQPMLCQHCDNAPCETVCPVLATMHSSEGLNEMIYNRCVGTRYCSNNCPYKVRRFNWFNYAKLIEKPTHMALNPDVTVRVRGVMEKCTFCVQRIKESKAKAKLNGEAIKDGDVKTACQVVCPSDAIVFGDLNDDNSEVAKLFKKDERAYAVLEEWGAAPSVRYLSKIRNNDQVTAAPHGHDEKKGDHA